MINYSIRKATQEDSAQILDIYTYYIENTAFTFEIDVPSIEQFTNRVNDICKDYPFLVCEQNSKIVGYAYASLHKQRQAYCYDVDVSIYLNKDSAGNGTGTKLYTALLKMLQMQGFYNAYAGITHPNEASVKFHKKHGFVEVGFFDKTGYKFNAWHGVKWFCKELNSFNIAPSGIIPACNIKLPST